MLVTALAAFLAIAPVPDAGSTGTLLGIAVIGVAIYFRFFGKK